MPQANERDGGDDAEALETKIARTELQARYYEAQIRLLEARRKWTAVRKPATGAA